MRLFLPWGAAVAMAVAGSPAPASLRVGDRAPEFAVEGVQGDTPAVLSLSKLLKAGPVVIFFMPTVYAGDSATEGREIANVADKFAAAGATVIGMTRDPLEQLAEFSREECGGRVAVASADLSLVTRYDVNDSANFTTSTSYVIATDGRIAFVDDDDEQAGHASRALGFVQRMKR